MTTEPLVALVVSVGGLWVLYVTALYALSREQPAVHLLVHLHPVVAGYLLAAALVGPDPMRHRRSPVHRALVLVAAVAGHDILAKYLYAHPPAGVAPAQAEVGAMVMYYGGDAVEVAIMVLLCAGWARRSSRSSRGSVVRLGSGSGGRGVGPYARTAPAALRPSALLRVGEVSGGQTASKPARSTRRW